MHQICSICLMDFFNFKGNVQRATQMIPLGKQALVYNFFLLCLSWFVRLQSVD